MTRPLVISMSLSLFSSCVSGENPSGITDKIMNENLDSTRFDTATLGAGCFWCVEAVFQELKGVHTVRSGYSGGKIANPTYREVCSGLTGHAEVIQVVY